MYLFWSVLSEAQRRNTAHIIAIGTLRYFLLKFTRNTVIVFDFKEALSFEGETGWFLSIFGGSRFVIPMRKNLSEESFLFSSSKRIVSRVEKFSVKFISNSPSPFFTISGGKSNLPVKF